MWTSVVLVFCMLSSGLILGGSMCVDEVMSRVFLGANLCVVVIWDFRRNVGADFDTPRIECGMESWKRWSAYLFWKKMVSVLCSCRMWCVTWASYVTPLRCGEMWTSFCILLLCSGLILGSSKSCFLLVEVWWWWREAVLCCYVVSFLEPNLCVVVVAYNLKIPAEMLL